MEWSQSSLQSEICNIQCLYHKMNKAHKSKIYMSTLKKLVSEKQTEPTSKKKLIKIDIEINKLKRWNISINPTDIKGTKRECYIQPNSVIQQLRWMEKQPKTWKLPKKVYPLSYSLRNTK